MVGLYYGVGPYLRVGSDSKESGPYIEVIDQWLHDFHNLYRINKHRNMKLQSR